MRCAVSPSLIWVHEPMRDANGWPGDVMADGVNPGGVARLLVLSGTSAASDGDRRLSGASRQHQLIGTRARTDHGDQAAFDARVLCSAGAVQASSPRARNV